MTNRVGFIGLGTMGLGMSRNLVRAGFEVHGFDIDPAKADKLAEHGGIAAASPTSAAEGANMLFVCVFSAKEAEALLAPSAVGGSQLLQVLAPNAIVVMHTTMSPAQSQALAATVSEQQVNFLEAPVTGGKQGAEDGTLTAIVSGRAQDLQRAQHALDTMCARVYHVGEAPGAAATVKMANQLLVGVHIAAASEAMALAVRAGADPQATFDVISNGGGNSKAFSTRVPRMLAGEPELPRTVEIFLKDLNIVQSAGSDLKLPLPLCASAYQLFLSAASLDDKTESEPSVLRVYEQIAGIKVGPQ